ncbi:MAG: DUF3368 domain-containing protein [Deltaproteobacteria bacterium]|nr:DUF3368 domain-containing protein [Deltaproteobacteria bacterium]
MKVICNTTPLIALSSIGEIDLLEKVYSTVMVPKAVVDEIMVGGKIHVPKLAHLAWIEVVPNITSFEDRLLYQLDYGERQVVLNALKLKADLTLIDDRVARNIAEYFGLTVKGTLGLLVDAKRKSLISSFKKKAIKMKNQGIYFSDKLIEAIASSLGEH